MKIDIIDEMREELNKGKQGREKFKENMRRHKTLVKREKKRMNHKKSLRLKILRGRSRKRRRSKKHAA